MISQEVTTETLLYDGLERSYILYIPTSYSENSPTPLVLNLHGYSSNAGQQMIYSDFYTIADNKGFILIHPEGTFDDFGFHTASHNLDDYGAGSVKKMCLEAGKGLSGPSKVLYIPWMMIFDD